MKLPAASFSIISNPLPVIRTIYLEWDLTPKGLVSIASWVQHLNHSAILVRWANISTGQKTNLVKIKRWTENNTVGVLETASQYFIGFLSQRLKLHWDWMNTSIEITRNGVWTQKDIWPLDLKLNTIIQLSAFWLQWQKSINATMKFPAVICPTRVSKHISLLAEYKYQLGFVPNFALFIDHILYSHYVKDTILKIFI